MWLINETADARNVVLRYFLRTALLLGVAIGASGYAAADDGMYDESVWKEYQSLRRHQVAAMNAIWFPDLRPGAIANTYLALSEQIASIDVSGCSGHLRRHVMKAESICTELVELHASFTRHEFRNFRELLRSGDTNSGAASSELERVFQLRTQLADAERALVDCLKIAE